MYLAITVNIEYPSWPATHMYFEIVRVLYLLFSISLTNSYETIGGTHF